MNEDRDIVRKCLIFLLEMLTMTKMFIVLVKNIISFFQKNPSAEERTPPLQKV